MKTYNFYRTKEAQKIIQDDQRKDAVLKGEGGASLLYVVSFCSSVFGSEAGLSHCRAQMMAKVRKKEPIIQDQ